MVTADLHQADWGQHKLQSLRPTEYELDDDIGVTGIRTSSESEWMEFFIQSDK